MSDLHLKSAKLDGYWPLAVSFVVLLNSAVLLFGFLQIRNLSTTVRLAGTSISRGAGEFARDTVRYSPSVHPVQVSLYYDFGCRFCRASVAAIDSARGAFGDSVHWNFRYLPNVESETSLLSAYAGACIADSSGPWALVSALQDRELTRESLRRGLRSIGRNPTDLTTCIRADGTQERVWSDIYRASAIGVVATPTVVIDGVVLRGEVHFAPLAAAIRERIRLRRDPAATSL